MPPDLAKQYQNFTRAETAKLRAVGCDTPPTPLEAGVRETVEFLLKNHPEGRADAAPPARQAA